MKTRGSSIRARAYGVLPGIWWMVAAGVPRYARGGRRIYDTPHYRTEDGQPPERGAGFFSRYGVQSGGGGDENQLFRRQFRKDTKSPNGDRPGNL